MPRRPTTEEWAVAQSQPDIEDRGEQGGAKASANKIAPPRLTLRVAHAK